MKLKYFTLLLLGAVSTLESLAQMTVDTIQYRFVYDVQMKTIEGSTSLDNDEHWLDIGKKGISSYYSNWKVQRLHLIDSIMSVGGTSADVIKEAQKQGFETSYFNYVICKNYPVQGQQTINYYSLQQLQYTEDMGMNWELEDGDTLILGYHCNKAITTYHGRTWTAWYAPDIPLMEGPWKLYGLPGLILRATDDRNEYVFSCIGIEKPQDIPIRLSVDKVVKMEPRKAHQIIEAMADDPEGYMLMKRGKKIKTMMLDKNGRSIPLTPIKWIHIESYK